MVHVLSSCLIAFLLPLVVTSCGQNAPESQPGDQRDELLETDRAFARFSTEHGPAKAFSEFLIEDALQLPNGSEPIYGRDEIVRSMSDGPGFELDWEPRRAEVSASADLGWTWGTYEATFQDSAGTDVTSAGKYLNVWRKQADGAWRVVVDMGNTP